MRQIKLAAFDVDGTLVDTKLDIADSMNRALGSVGMPERPLEVYGMIVGNGPHVAAARACPPDTAGDVINTVAERYKEIYAQRYRERSRVYDGIGEIIGRLQLQGVVMGVLSNKSDSAVADFLDYYFPQKPFAAARGSVYSEPMKPEPHMGFWLCEKLGVPPENGLYLGDSDSDMQFARAVGFLAVGAGWGFRGKEELAAAGADVVLDTPLQLLDLLV